MGDGQWCILRTSGRSTLKLAETLAEDGFETWTPRETRRKQRSHVRREVTLPMLPSYVFARASQAHDLLRLSRDIASGWGSGRGRPNHPAFTLWLFGEKAVTIADQHLTALKRIEAKRKPRKKADRIFEPGVQVRVRQEGASFAGMVGRVEKSDTGHTLVCFSSKFVVKIATSLLDVNDLGSQQSAAARMAA